MAHEARRLCGEKKRTGVEVSAQVRIWQCTLDFTLTKFKDQIRLELIKLELSYIYIYFLN